MFDFAVLSNPEFLREGTAVQDYYNPPVTLIGGSCDKATEKLAGLYKDLPAEVVITDIEVIEIMKYINNTFHALKISFANEVGNICKALGINSHKVMDLFVKGQTAEHLPILFPTRFCLRRIMPPQRS